MKRVTHVLTECGLREWPRHMSAEDREWYLQRGSFIHKATELFDRDTLDWTALDARIEPYVRAWERFRKEVGGEVVGIELKVKSVRFDYRGTLDRIIDKSNIYPAGKLLIDIKTSEADPATALQTAAYAMAWGKYGGRCKRASVALLDTGKYRFEMYEQDASDTAGWMGCLALYSWKERNGLIKEKSE